MAYSDYLAGKNEAGENAEIYINIPNGTNDNEVYNLCITMTPQVKRMVLSFLTDIVSVMNGGKHNTANNSPNFLSGGGNKKTRKHR